MRIAIALTGNLRTFFMPTREDVKTKVCDVFMRQIVSPNKADVFVSTDSVAFYLNGAEHFSSSFVDIYNGEKHRLHDNPVLTPHPEGRGMILEELRKVVGPNLAGARVGEVHDATSDPKYQVLDSFQSSGSHPVMLIQQYRKLKIAHEMILTHERENGRYDIVIKCRPDNMYPNASPLRMTSYDFSDTDAYGPGMRGAAFIHDWYAFGKRDAMMKYLALYDRLGDVLLPGKFYLSQCEACGHAWDRPHPVKVPCDKCGRADRVISTEETMASERHVYCLFQREGIRYRTAPYPVYVYRYRDTNAREGHCDEQRYKEAGIQINAHRSQISQRKKRK